jgi:hypothetical protein
MYTQPPGEAVQNASDVAPVHVSDCATVIIAFVIVEVDAGIVTVARLMQWLVPEGSVGRVGLAAAVPCNTSIVPVDELVPALTTRAMIRSIRGFVDVAVMSRSVFAVNVNPYGGTVPALPGTTTDPAFTVTAAPGVPR